MRGAQREITGWLIAQGYKPEVATRHSFTVAGLEAEPELAPARLLSVATEY
jgi:hypothetical protein